MLALHISPVKKRLIIYVIVLLFPAFFLFLLIFSMNTQNSSIHGAYFVETLPQINDINSAQLLSLSANSTIKKALYELNSGYQVIKDNTNAKNIAKNKIEKKYLANQNGVSHNNTQIIDYLNAFNKYHSFFLAYIKKLGYKNIYIIEPLNSTVIYTTDLAGVKLFEGYNNVSFNKIIESIRISAVKNKIYKSGPDETNETFISVAVFSENVLTGIIIVALPDKSLSI